MGIIYYLAREDDRTLFELGKFREISDLFAELGEGRAKEWEFLPREVPPEPDLRELIRVAIDDSNLDVDPDAYAAELARRIVAFADGRQVCLLNDASSDDEMDEHYKTNDGDLNVVGSVDTTEWGDWESRHPRASQPAEG